MPLTRFSVIEPGNTSAPQPREVLVKGEGPSPVSVEKHRLSGGLADGIDVLDVDNGLFSFRVLLSKGMGLWRGRCGDVDLKWDSPVHGPVHPRHVPVFHPSGLGWLEGFDEWIARCGLVSNGAPEFGPNGVLKYPLHGRIQNLPAREASVSFDSDTGEITVSGTVDEAALFSSKLALNVSYSTAAGSSRLRVCDEVVNLGSVPAEFELLYHINTGFPFITPGAQVIVPFEKMTPREKNARENIQVWDRFLPETPNIAEHCYLFEMAADSLGRTRVLLLNAQKDRAISLSFNKNEFPHFLIWKLMRPNGDTYVSGIEPCVNFPNTRSFEKEHGRVVTLEPGASRVFHFDIDILLTPAEIALAQEDIKSLQAAAAGTIEAEPIKEWCE